MELSKTLTEIINEDLAPTKTFAITLKPSGEPSEEMGEHEDLCDRDRIEIALEMLYGIKDYVHGLNRAVQSLEDLLECCDEENYDEEDDEFEDLDD